MDWTAEIKKISEKHKINVKSQQSHNTTMTHSQGSLAAGQHNRQQSIGSASASNTFLATQRSQSTQQFVEESVVEEEEEKEGVNEAIE